MSGSIEDDYDPNHIHLSQDFPPSIRQALLDLESEDPVVYKGALQTLTIANHPTAIDALAMAAQHSNRELRIKAALALAEATLEDKRAIPGLQEALLVEDVEVRRSALRWLGAVADPTTVPSLIKAMENPETIEQAGIALVQIGPDALNGLRKVVFNLHALRSAHEALYFAHQIGEASIPLLVEVVNRNVHIELTVTAVELLGERGDPSTANTIVRVLRTGKEALLRRIAAIALGSISNPQTVPDLIQALRDQDNGVAKAAYGALKKIGTAEAIMAAEEWANNLIDEESK